MFERFFDLGFVDKVLVGPHEVVSDLLRRELSKLRRRDDSESDEPPVPAGADDELDPPDYPG